ncbi:MAG: hypothetical protein ACOYT4_05350 [Nanoarchaeota archaeon]
MSRLQEKSTLNHERIAGAEYGKTFGGIYYENLEHYIIPALDFVKNSRREKTIFSICDLGGGSGIVGCSLLKSILELGEKVRLTIYDNNPKQLEGIDYEANRLSIPRKFIHPICYNISLRDKDSKKFDIVSMRKVLHYFNRQGNFRLISKLPDYLKLDGILILGALCEKNSEEAGYKSKILNEIEKAINNKEKIYEKYISYDLELENLLMSSRLKTISSSEYFENISIQGIKEKWNLSNDNIQKIASILSPHSDFHNWRNKVFVCKID